MFHDLDLGHARTEFGKVTPTRHPRRPDSGGTRANGGEIGTQAKARREFGGRSRRHVSTLWSGDAVLARGGSGRGRERLRSLIADYPDDQIVAYQQLGQSYAETGETAAAVTTLQTGIVKARSRGDWHAAAEMEQLVNSLQ